MVGANQFMEIRADFRRRVWQGQANDTGVLFQAPPVALVRKRLSARNAHCGEDAPAADQPRLAGRKADLLDGEKAFVVENVRMNHSCHSISGTKKIL